MLRLFLLLVIQVCVSLCVCPKIPKPLNLLDSYPSRVVPLSSSASSLKKGGFGLGFKMGLGFRWVNMGSPFYYGISILLWDLHFTMGSPVTMGSPFWSCAPTLLVISIFTTRDPCNFQIVGGGPSDFRISGSSAPPSFLEPQSPLY